MTCIMKTVGHAPPPTFFLPVHSSAQAIARAGKADFGGERDRKRVLPSATPLHRTSSCSEAFPPPKTKKLSVRPFS